jgi:hypothetical protein
LGNLYRKLWINDKKEENFKKAKKYYKKAVKETGMRKY